MKMMFFVLFAGLVLLTGNACTHDPMVTDNIDTVCFSRDILPIFQNSCAMAGCHDGNQESFDATSYDAIMRSVTPGHANKSRVYHAITSVYFNTMPPPPNQPLSLRQRTLIALWINQGAKNSTCSDTVSLKMNKN